MKLNKIISYIFRSWDNETVKPHPILKILPPFIYELLGYIILLSILYQIIVNIMFTN